MKKMFYRFLNSKVLVHWSSKDTQIMQIIRINYFSHLITKNPQAANKAVKIT